MPSGRWLINSLSARYGSFFPPSRRNILLLYFRLFAGVSASPFLVFVDLSPKVKWEPLSTKSPSLQSRCSFMARIPNIRMLFHHTRFSSCRGVSKPIAPLDQSFSVCSSSSGSQAFWTISLPNRLELFPFWREFILQVFVFSNVEALALRLRSFQKISSQPIPVSSECSRLVFFTFFSLSCISNFEEKVLQYTVSCLLCNCREIERFSVTLYMPRH